MNLLLSILLECKIYVIEALTYSQARLQEILLYSEVLRMFYIDRLQRSYKSSNGTFYEWQPLLQRYQIPSPLHSPLLELSGVGCQLGREMKLNAQKTDGLLLR